MAFGQQVQAVVALRAELWGRRRVGRAGVGPVGSGAAQAWNEARLETHGGRLRPCMPPRAGRPCSERPPAQERQARTRLVSVPLNHEMCTPPLSRSKFHLRGVGGRLDGCRAGTARGGRGGQGLRERGVCRAAAAFKRHSWTAESRRIGTRRARRRRRGARGQAAGSRLWLQLARECGAAGSAKAGGLEQRSVEGCGRRGRPGAHGGAPFLHPPSSLVEALPLLPLLVPVPLLHERAPEALQAPWAWARSRAAANPAHAGHAPPPACCRRPSTHLGVRQALLIHPLVLLHRAEVRPLRHVLWRLYDGVVHGAGVKKRTLEAGWGWS